LTRVKIVLGGGFGVGLDSVSTAGLPEAMASTSA
jgi:hypothetical protein